MMNKNIRDQWCWICFGLLSVCRAISADEEPNAALQNINSSVRLRYADVQQTDERGAALSALLRVNWAADWSTEWASVVELDFIARGLRDQHSDGVINNGEPLIPDPAGSELNQIFLAQQTESLTWQLGRQRIEHGNQRFVGGNGFWQNEQTFDGLTVSMPFAEASRWQYAYIYNVNRIFGEEATHHLTDSDAQYGELSGERPKTRWGDHRLQSHWLLLEWREWDYQRINFYAYDNEYLDFTSWSYRMVGARHEWDFKQQQWRWRTQAERAYQDRYELPEAKITPYTLVELALGFSAWELAWHHEVLSSRAGRAFIAPLGSAHDFHGVVGKFAGTPSDGLREQSLRLSWRQAPWLVEARYAQFENAAHGALLGDEFDLILRWRPLRTQSVSLSAGRFNAASAATLNDERRFYLDYRFEY
jgi:hypothetical protein